MYSLKVLWSAGKITANHKSIYQDGVNVFAVQICENRFYKTDYGSILDYWVNGSTSLYGRHDYL